MASILSEYTNLFNSLLNYLARTILWFNMKRRQKSLILKYFQINH